MGSLEAPGPWRGVRESVQGVIVVLILPLSGFAALGKPLHRSVLRFSCLSLLRGVAVRIDGGTYNGLRNRETGIEFSTWLILAIICYDPASLTIIKLST